jgi:NAD(P)-dependent dehydrogenase (short-subunit alcohol dehydrogenase family)
MANSSSFDPVSQFRVDGKIAIVTGASSGLGARFARVLHAAGATVVLTARRLDRLESLSKELPGSISIKCDVASAADREALIAEVISTCGRVDILVNNAGITHKIAIESETLDMFEETMEVNTTAIWHLCKLAGENMVANRSGVIVNVASILGMIAGTPIKQANYAASKGAVIALSREIAVQWARKGVRVNSLCPGWFVSEMTAGMDTDDSSQKYVMQNSPIPRMGAEHELDGALLFMVSDASSFMTGQSVIVDGGWTAR